MATNIKQNEALRATMELKDPVTVKDYQNYWEIFNKHYHADVVGTLRKAQYFAGLSVVTNLEYSDAEGGRVNGLKQPYDVPVSIMYWVASETDEYIAEQTQIPND